MGIHLYCSVLPLTPSGAWKTFQDTRKGARDDRLALPNGSVSSSTQETTAVDSTTTQGKVETNSKEQLATGAEVTVAQPSANCPLPMCLTMAGSTHTSQDVRAFLGNAFKLADGAIGTATTGVVYSVNLPADFLAIPAVRQKIWGYVGFKADFRVRFTVNATDTMACRLFFNSVPFIDAPGLLMSERISQVQTNIQFEHITMDPSCSSEVEWIVPWRYHYPWFDFSQGVAPPATIANYSMATIAMSIYSQLRVGSGGSSSFNWTCWVSAIPETIELFNPVYPGSYVPQIAQSGGGSVRRTRAVTEKEQAASGASSFSSMVRSFGTVADAAGAVFPSLRSLGMPSWYLNFIADSLGSFGYSKPHVESAPQFMSPVAGGSPLRLQINSDTADLSIPLGMHQNARTAPLIGLDGDDGDPLAISRLIAKPAWVSAFNWGPSDVSDTVLMTFNVHPQQNTSLGVNLSRTVYVGGMLNYLSNFFWLWRGSIVLRLRFVKTAYHTGRLMLCYQPAHPFGYIATTAQSQWVHRELIDLADVDDIEITLPFTSQRSWHNLTGLTQANASYGSFDPSGIFSLLVVNELVAPSTVTPSIEVIAEYFAGPDFEFSRPRLGNGIMPYTDTDPFPQEAQSGSIAMRRNRGMACSISKISLGTASSCPDMKVYTQAEAVRSLRDFLLCGSTLETTSLTTQTYFAVRPYTIAMMYKVGVGNYAFGDLHGDYWNAIAPLFAMNRGGVNLATASDISPSVIKTWLDYETVAGPPINTTPSNRAAMSNYARANYTENIKTTQVTIPFSCEGMAHFNRMSYWDSTHNVPEPYLRLTPRAVIRYKSSVSMQTPLIIRSFPDDIQLLFFIGAPPYVAVINSPLPEQSIVPEASPSMVTASAIPASGLSAPQIAARTLTLSSPVIKKTTVVPV